MDTSDSRLYPYVHNTYIIVVYYTDTDTDFWRHALKILYIIMSYIHFAKIPLNFLIAFLHYV